MANKGVLTHRQKLAIARAAFREIMKKEGPFSMDHHKHAENTIDSMAQIAEKALRDIGD